MRREFRRQFGISDNEKLVLQIGSGFKVKGVDRSLTAIASLPSEVRGVTKFMLIGQDKSARFKKQAKNLGIDNQVVILTGRDDVPRFLAGADILLHPAYLESAGYVLLEATIAGLPVLTTASCGYSYHIEKAQSGEVCSEPFRQKELNDRLLHMMQNLGTTPWADNGLKYGKEMDLYTLPETVTDLIEKLTKKTD